ncbi:MAG: hypothetical protein JKY67_21130 [Pseudomonadales bacterium]|nr:hypothetical protein [Pseudomonadales bacterium]
MNSLQNKAALYQYDELFENVLNSLSKNLLVTVQSATQQILDISTQFLSTEASKVISDFHHLYAADSHFEDLKDSVDQGVDELITLIQNNDSSNADELNNAIEKIDTHQMAAARLSFSALQKDMEALISLEDNIKNKVLPIFHGLQFEDLLCLMVKTIDSIWHEVISDIHQTEPFNIKSTLTKIYSQLHCEKQRSLFFETVLKADYKDSILEISPAVLSQYAGDLLSEKLKENLLVDIESFTRSTLAWNEKNSSEAIDPILKIIIEVRQTATDTGNISDDSMEALEQIKLVVGAINRSSKKAATKALLSSIQNRMDVDDTIEELINTVMTSVQFQDRIRQNMENLSKSILSWRSLRDIVLDGSELTDEKKYDLGTKLLKNMTMNEEREIIRHYIPNLPSGGAVNEDDFELF